jgi:O-antigen ligase
VTLALGGSALALSALTGSRTASLVILILVLVAPSLGMSWRLRTAIAVAALVAFGMALSFPALQERWFTEGDDGSLVDVVTFNSNFDTSGRTTVWSALWTAGRARPLLGKGLGSANVAGAAIDEGFGQPHNEYLRVFCDTGIAGSVLLWGFFAGVGRRAVAVTRVPGASRTAAAAALLLLLGLALFAATDNVLTATLQYAAPAAVVFAWSDRAHAACAPRRSRHSGVLESR